MRTWEALGPHPHTGVGSPRLYLAGGPQTGVSNCFLSQAPVPTGPLFLLVLIWGLQGPPPASSPARASGPPRNQAPLASSARPGLLLGREVPWGGAGDPYLPPGVTSQAPLARGGLEVPARGQPRRPQPHVLHRPTPPLLKGWLWALDPVDLVPRGLVPRAKATLWPGHHLQPPRGRLSGHPRARAKVTVEVLLLRWPGGGALSGGDPGSGRGPPLLPPSSPPESPSCEPSLKCPCCPLCFRCVMRPRCS